MSIKSVALAALVVGAFAAGSVQAADAVVSAGAPLAVAVQADVFTAKKGSATPLERHRRHRGCRSCE